jgi:hypothetical protein
MLWRLLLNRDFMITIWNMLSRKLLTLKLALAVVILSDLMKAFKMYMLKVKLIYSFPKDTDDAPAGSIGWMIKSYTCFN